MKSLGQHKVSLLEKNGTVLLSLHNGLTVVVESSDTSCEVSLTDRHNKKIVNAVNVTSSQSFSLFRNYISKLIGEHVQVELTLEWVEQQFKKYYVKNDDVVNVEDYFIDHPFDTATLIPLQGDLSDFSTEMTDLVRPFYHVSNKDHFVLDNNSHSLFKTSCGKVVTFGNVLVGGDLVEGGALLPLKQSLADEILKNANQ